MKERDEFKITIFDTFIQVYKNLTEVLIRTEHIEEALLACERGKARALEDLLSLKYSLKGTKKEHLLNLGDPYKISLRQDVGIVICDVFYDSFVRYWIISPQTKEIFFYNEDVCSDTFKAMDSRPKNEQDGSDLEGKSLQNVIESSYAHMNLRGMQCEDRSMAMLESENPIAIQESRWICDDAEEEKPLQILYERIVAPIQQNLIQDEIVIIPDGPLYMVPFAALQDSNGNYLSESKCIRLAPSLTALKILQESSEDHSTKVSHAYGQTPEWIETCSNSTLLWFDASEHSICPFKMFSR